MSIDLDTPEGRKEYLSEKLDDLLDGINESYGTVLMEELLNRLELTIKDFSDEMKVLCDQLVKKQDERQNLLEMLRSKELLFKEVGKGQSSSSTDDTLLDILKSDISDQPTPKSSEESEEDIPLWEKKLSKLKKNK